jgi:HlyD family secretion protein
MTKRLWLAIGAVIISVGAGIYYYRSDVAAETPTINTAEVTKGPVVSTVEATGTMGAVTTVEVGSQVSGTIKALHADFNSEVRRGQVIAELDPSLFETQVAQEQATVTRLKAEVDRARVQAEDAAVKFRRARELSEKELIARSDLDAAESTARAADSAVKSAQAQLVQAQASLNQAQVNLSHTIIRAPIDGVVIARNVNVGQTVAASMSAPTLFIIAQDLTDMQVSASIDESDIGKIQVKQPVRFRVDAYPNQTFTGTVSQVRLQPVVNQNVVSYVTIIDVPNPDLKLKPGMTAAVTVETARADNVVKVPTAALRFRPTEEIFTSLGQTVPERLRNARNNSSGSGTRDSGSGNRIRGSGESRIPSPESRVQGAVWVLEQGALKRVSVQTGISDGTHTAVLSGDLAPGARVVTGSTSASTAQAPTTGSPLIPFGGRRGGGRL